MRNGARDVTRAERNPSHDDPPIAGRTQLDGQPVSSGSEGGLGESRKSDSGLDEGVLSGREVSAGTVTAVQPGRRGYGTGMSSSMPGDTAVPARGR